MKILFLNYEYPPLGGGAANATFCILREYARVSDLEVDLVTSSIDSNYYKEKIGERITIHKIPIGKNKSNLHFQSQKDLLIYAWKAYAFSKKLCRQNKYDLSHSFFTVPCGFLSFLLKRNFKIPYVISLRGSDVPGYSDRFSWLYIFLKPFIKLIWKKADAVISNSVGLRTLALKTKSDQKIGIIYNGINTEIFKPDENMPDREKFIITSGASRLTDRKGLNYLVEAVAILVSKYPNVQLKIIGEGNAKKRLEELSEKMKIKDKVEFIGRVSHREVSKYYQEADVFVLPSLNEGMSNAMLEALSSGLPLLATDTGGTKELVTDGENGYVIKMKNASNIAEKIEKLINNSELKKKMGEASRQKALGLSWKKVAGEYYKLYSNLCLKNTQS